MKFTINSKQLLYALIVTSKGLSTSAITPSAYRFHKVGDRLEIETCNLEISMQTSLPCEIAEDLDILIPSEKIATLLSSLPDQPLIFTISGEEISIRASSGIYTLVGISAKDYPVIKVETSNNMAISAESLSEAIYATAYARSKDQAQLRFTGLSIIADKEKLQFAGCNLMALSIFNIKGKFKPAKILLPTVIADAIGALSIPGDCKISYSENSICFNYDNLVVKSMLMDEQYPDYLNIVPKNEVKVSLNRAELLASIKRVLQFSNKERKITLNSDTEFYISGVDTDYNQSAQEQLKMSDIDTIDISLNGEFLSNALSRFSSELIEIWWQAPNKAILINEPGDKENFAMLMAMII